MEDAHSNHDWGISGAVTSRPSQQAELGNVHVSTYIHTYVSVTISGSVCVCITYYNNEFILIVQFVT